MESITTQFRTDFKSMLLRQAILITSVKLGFVFGAIFEVFNMVSVRLSDNSTIPRLVLRGLKQAPVITRRESVSVPLAWAIPRLSDKELLFRVR